MKDESSEWPPKLLNGQELVRKVISKQQKSLPRYLVAAIW